MESEIVPVLNADVEAITALFAREYYASLEEAIAHFADHIGGDGASFLAYVEGTWAGFITIRWVSHNPDFRANKIPLIHYIEVFQPFRRQSIASRLMEVAEDLIATRATKVGITVGLTEEYGGAQRLYAKRGYLPDGRGACQAHCPLRHGELVTMDHDLIIWLTKDLTQ